jgi:hypothetical protein
MGFSGENPGGRTAVRRYRMADFNQEPEGILLRAGTGKPSDPANLLEIWEHPPI